MKSAVLLTDRGCDRATAYHQAGKIVRTSKGVFVTWLDADYRCVLAQLDETGRVLQQYPIAQAWDNHCGAAMTMTADGVVHVVSGSHGMAFMYIKSATPWDKTSWSLPEVVGVTATYPSLTHSPDGVVHLAHRRSGMVGDEHWGVAHHMTSKGRPWGPQKGLFWRMPAPLYSYPTNALACGGDGKLHVVIEWYKTWPGGATAPAARSLGVSHFELPAGPGNGEFPKYTWKHSDGRDATAWPIKFEESQPLAYPGGEDPRPGNVAVLPDGRVVFGVWNSTTGRAELVVQQADKGFRNIDLTVFGQSHDPGRKFGSQPQVAVNSKGQVVVVIVRDDNGAWGAASNQLNLYVVEPDSGQVVRHEAIAKAEPSEPDWLASLERPGPGVYPDTFGLLYQTGMRGQGCVNQALCRVRYMTVG
jgi:hypothetical protein